MQNRFIHLFIQSLREQLLNTYLGKYLGMEWLDHTARVYLNFKEIVKPISKAVVPSYFFFVALINT